MARLALMLLGPFQATLDDQPVEFATDKMRALLAYLAVESDRVHPRESVVGLLWPDYAETSARQSLSQALSRLRVILGDRDAGDDPMQPPYLLITRDTLRFNPQSDHQLDIATLNQDLSALGELSSAQAIACLQEAVALYRGPFLEGFSLGDSAPFEEWATLKREEYLRCVLAALHQLVELQEQEGNYDQAQRWARRQVELEPLDEGAHRQLMRALALGGQRSASLAQYEACRRLLASELGVDPAPETVALYEAIRHGTVGPIGVGAVAGRARTQAVLLPSEAYSVAAETSNEDEDIPESSRPLFVARQEELAHLKQWLLEALQGQGRVGFVVGEPGSGKTMLLAEFARGAMETHPTLIVAGGTCNAYAGMGDPYLPFLELVQALLGGIGADRALGAISREHARRLRAATPLALDAVLQMGPGLVDMLLPGALLLERARSLPNAAAWETRVQAAIDHRAGVPSQIFLFEQVTRVLQTLAKRQPLLLLLDDLQWADTASISLLFHLGRRLGSPGSPGPRVLILGTYRPEEVAAGREGRPHPLQAVLLEFQRTWDDTQVDLSQAEGRAFVEALVDSEPNGLGAAFREALHQQTGGQALFTVELLRGLQQRGDLLRDGQGRWVEGATLDWGRLPRRVEAAIASHIARLPREEQELLSVASVEGEEFTAEVVAEIEQRDARDVLRALSGPLSQEHRLVNAHSLRRIGERRFSRYRFRHYLFQRYLYQRLDPVRRAHLHREVASALEALGGAPPAPRWATTDAYLAERWDHPLAGPEGIVSEGAMAWHWEEAGLAEKAAVYHLYAVKEIGVESYAYEDAIWHARKCLDLLATLPDSPGRAHLQQLAYLGYGFYLGCSIGWIAPEVGHAYRRRLECAERLGDALLVVEALTWLAFYHRQCGELDTALALNERAVGLTQGEPLGGMAIVQGDLAQTLLLRGELAASLRLCEPLSEALLSTGAMPPWGSINDLVHVPWALWGLGYPDRALRVAEAAMEMALRDKEKNQIGTDGQVLRDGICFTHQLRREVQGVEHGLRLLLPLVEQDPSPVARCFATLYQGWVQAQRGGVEQGIETLRRGVEQGIETLRRGIAEWSQGYVVLRPYWKGYLAEALARAGRVDEGLALLEEALEQVARTGEGFAEAELHRLKGELLLQHGDDPAEVEARYRQAIAVAQCQEARSWELRATTSLARLLRGQGRCEEARHGLAAIYGWFSEGFDTPDLQEAKALLDALG